MFSIISCKTTIFFLAFTRTPAFLYNKYHDDRESTKYHGYPPLIMKHTYALSSNTHGRYLEAVTGSCFLNPDICVKGSSVGMKLKIIDSTITEKIDFIVQSEGIEIFVDEYERLCGLLRTRQPNREWKVRIFI